MRVWLYLLHLLFEIEEWLEEGGVYMRGHLRDAKDECK